MSSHGRCCSTACNPNPSPTPATMVEKKGGVQYCPFQNSCYKDCKFYQQVQTHEALIIDLQKKIADLLEMVHKLQEEPPKKQSSCLCS
jgi:hypothetical protein